MKNIQISMKEITVYILDNWITVLLCVCLFGAGFGGYQFLKLPKGSALQAMIDTQNERYETEKKVAEENLSNLRTMIEKRTNDINRVLAVSSFTNKRIVTINLDIIVDHSRVDIGRIRDALRKMFDTISLQDLYKDIYSSVFEEEYLRSIVTQKIETIDGYPSRIVISSIGGEEFNPEIAADRLADYIISQTSTIAASTGEYSIQMFNRTVGNADNDATLFANDINTWRQNIDIYYTEIEAINQKLADLKPENLGSIKPVIESGLIGAAVGLFVGVFFVATIYAYRLPITIPEQVNDQLGVRYIGGYSYGGGVFLSAIANALAGNFLLFKDRKKATIYVSLNLRQAISPEDVLLITGSVSMNVIDDFVREIKTDANWEDIKLICAPDINTSIEGLAALEECSKVLLVERLKKSTLKNIAREIDRIDVSGKEIVGYVLY